MTAPETPLPQDTETFTLSRSDWVLNFAFWTFYGLIVSANRLMDPHGARQQVEFFSGPIALAFAEAYLWAFLTPLIFRLAARYSRASVSWAQRIGVLGIVGLVIAISVNSLIGHARQIFFPPPPPPMVEHLRRMLDTGFFGDGPLGGVTRLWFINDLVIYGAILAAGVARAYSHRYQMRLAEAHRLSTRAAQLQAELAEAQLATLRMQLDPHFLFNTLHAMSSLVERDPRGVRRMISRLSEMLRLTLEAPKDAEIPLSQELALLERYLDIMRIRFQGRLDATIDVPESLRTALVPSMLLQPLVENAMKHGISHIEDTGVVSVTAERDGNALVFRVTDNGPPHATPPSIAEGLGVRNTRERLEHLYGDAQSFVLTPGAERGMVAEVRIPYHTSSDLRATGATFE